MLLGIAYGSSSARECASDDQRLRSLGDTFCCKTLQSKKLIYSVARCFCFQELWYIAKQVKHEQWIIIVNAPQFVSFVMKFKIKTPVLHSCSQESNEPFDIGTTPRFDDIRYSRRLQNRYRPISICGIRMVHRYFLMQYVLDDCNKYLSLIKFKTTFQIMRWTFLYMIASLCHHIHEL